MLTWLSKFNKAWVAAAVSFVGLSAMTFFGVTISPTAQATIISAVTAILTFLVPNYS